MEISVIWDGDMAVSIKVLVEALAELFGIDETEALNRLLEKGISNYSDFLRYLNEVRRQDRMWTS